MPAAAIPTAFGQVEHVAQQGFIEWKVQVYRTWTVRVDHCFGKGARREGPPGSSRRPQSKTGRARPPKRSAVQRILIDRLVSSEAVKLRWPVRCANDQGDLRVVRLYHRRVK